MSKKKIIFIELIFIGLIIAIITMYICLARVLYEVRDNTIQTLKDHRTMQCTIAQTKDKKNIIICYPDISELSIDTTDI